MSLGTGRPVVLRDEVTIRNCRLLLNHPMSTATDVRLIAQIELIGQKSELIILTQQLKTDPRPSQHLRDTQQSAIRPSHSQHPVVHPPRGYRARQMVAGL